MTPTERLEWLLNRPELARAHGAITKLLEHYERFLETTNISENELVARFKDKSASQSYMRDSYRFGDLVFDELSSLSNRNRFHRLLVVYTVDSRSEQLSSMKKETCRERVCDVILWRAEGLCKFVNCVVREVATVARELRDL